MKIVQINSTSNIGSTGKICVGISEVLNKNNIENYIICRLGDKKKKGNIIVCSNLYYKLQALKEKIKGTQGFEAKFATNKIIKILDKIDPDIVHLHNLHSHEINLKILFKYLNKKNIKIVWTFHDCWAYTGYCMYYDLESCDKWKEKCGACVQKKSYSWIVDKSSCLYDLKKSLYGKNLNITIVTPSYWLKKEVESSFLGNSDIRVINNGIDLNIFKSVDSSFKNKYGLLDKKIILGVAFDWGKRKGLDVFFELSKMLDLKKYAIVMVGIDSKINKIIPPDIITIYRTQNQQELAEIYSSADVFVNPTREDNFPTVNIEALACGTPVITFDAGGSPEILNKSSGRVVKCNDIESLYKNILDICENNPILSSSCQQRAMLFDKNDKYEEYLSLYKEILKK